MNQQDYLLDFIYRWHYPETKPNSTEAKFRGHRFYHEEGSIEWRRIDSQDDVAFVPCFQYTIRDHLGNGRVYFTKDYDGDNLLDVLQESHCYPFGAQLEGLSRLYDPPGSVPNASNGYDYTEEEDPTFIEYLQYTHDLKRYNGKEYNRELGLNWYDYGARWYDPVIGRWNRVDPLAEHPNQISWTPYHYVYNNPVNHTDPDGQCSDCLDFVKGVGKGIWSGVKETANGIVQAVTHPVQTVGAVVDAVVNYEETLDNIGNAAANTVVNFTLGNADTKGEIVGKGIVATADVAIGAKGTTKAAKLGKGAKTPECFVAGTIILLPTGETFIEDIAVGDIVLAFDEETSLIAPKIVIRLFEREVEATIIIELENGEVIETTHEHPFYIDSKWLKAKDLKVGNEVFLRDGSKLKITRISVKKEKTTVYNFEVEDFHTYFVSGSGVLVHNSCDPYLTTRAKELHSNLHWFKQKLTTTGVTEAVDEAGNITHFVAHSDKYLPKDIKDNLKSGEVGVTAIEGHAEVSGITAAQNAGLTPTKVGASRSICPSCQDFSKLHNVQTVGPLKPRE